MYFLHSLSLSQTLPSAVSGTFRGQHPDDIIRTQWGDLPVFKSEWYIEIKNQRFSSVKQKIISSRYRGTDWENTFAVRRVTQVRKDGSNILFKLDVRYAVNPTYDITEDFVFYVELRKDNGQEYSLLLKSSEKTDLALFHRTIDVELTSWDPEKESLQQQIKLDNLIKSGHEAFQKGDFSAAIDFYLSAINNNTTALPKSELQLRNIMQDVGHNLAESYYQLGSQKIGENEPANACSYLLQARKYSKRYNLDITTDVDKKLSIAYASLAQDKFAEKNYGDAIWLFETSLKLDSTNRSAQNGLADVGSLRRNPSKAALFGIIPGGGQLYNQNYALGALFFSAGAVGTFIAISSLNKANDLDAKAVELWKTGPHVGPGGAVWTEEEAKKERGKASLGLGIAIAAVAGGIWQAITETEDYNTRFNPTKSLEEFRLSYLPSQHRYNLTLSLRF